MSGTYYFLEKVIIDEKKHYSLRGVLHGKGKKKLENIFDDGVAHKNMPAPFTLVLDVSDSLTSRRTLTDKISSSSKGTGLLFLVSPKTQKLFTKLLPKDLEMYEVHIKGDKFALEDYKIVKVINKIDCVDLEKSDLDYDEDYDSIDSAETIVLDEKRIPKGKQIFLLGQREAAVIVVHKNLRAAIEKTGLTGFRFFPLDEAYMVIA